MKENSKLIKALKLLGEEYKSELPSSYLEKLVHEGMINEQQVYDTIEKRPFVWERGSWKKETPLWISEAIKQFENDLDDVCHPRSPFSIAEYSRFPIFQDYYSVMENFIQTEIETRHSKLIQMLQEMKGNKLNETVDLEVETYLAENDLEISEEFAHVLRSSLFIALLAYTESFLIDRYRVDAQGKDRKIPKDAVIKNTVDTLAGSLKMKIPGWKDHVLNFIEIRNCLVHEDGFLDNSDRHQAIRDYLSPEKISKKSVSKESYEKYEKIILTKEFCEEALNTMKCFLLSVDFVAKKLGTSGHHSQAKNLS